MAATSPEPLLQSILADIQADLDIALFAPSRGPTTVAATAADASSEQIDEDTWPSGPSAGGKRPRAKNGVPSAKEVQELERELAAKLAQARQLAAENQALVDKAHVLDMVMASHEDLNARYKELEAGLQHEPLAELGVCLKDLRGMTAQGVLDTFKELQVSAGKELVTYELTGVVTPLLSQLGKGLVEACKYIGLLRPDLMLYYAMHVDSLINERDIVKSAEAMPRPPQGFWRKVALAAKVQGPKLRQCAVLQSLMDQWLERVHAERRVLLAALHDTCSGDASLARYLEPAAGRTGSGSGSRPSPLPLYSSLQPVPLSGGGLVGIPDEIPEEAVVKRLQANVNREGNLIMLIGEILYCRILSELEGTRLVVHSHPFIPDDVAILVELAQLGRENLQRADAQQSKALTHQERSC